MSKENTGITISLEYDWRDAMREGVKFGIIELKSGKKEDVKYTSVDTSGAKTQFTFWTGDFSKFQPNGCDETAQKLADERKMILSKTLENKRNRTLEQSIKELFNSVSKNGDTQRAQGKLFGFTPLNNGQGFDKN